MKTKYLYIDEVGLWFRVFGYGLCVINREKQPALYSSRNGQRKELLIKGFGVRVLTPGS